MELALVLLGIFGPLAAFIAMGFGVAAEDALSPLVVILVVAGVLAVFV